MKHVGVFGGSFNPIHCGHVALAEAVLRQTQTDEIWFMVSPQNPLKQQDELLDDRQRLALAEKALAGHPRIQVSDYEMHLPRPSYTWNLLEALSRDFPDHAFSLIIGGDNWECFNRWHRADDIRRTYPVMVYPRPGSTMDAAPREDDKGLTVIEAPLLNVSSTAIRRRVRQGEEICGMVPNCIICDVERLYRQRTETEDRK